MTGVKPDCLVHLGARLTYLTPDLKEASSFSLRQGRELSLESLGGNPSRAATDWVRYQHASSRSPLVYAGDALSTRVLEQAGITHAPMPWRTLRTIRTSGFTPIPRATLLALGERDLIQAASSLEEQITVLSRECDRLERLIRREEENVGYLGLSSVEGTPVGTYAKGVARGRDTMKTLLGEADLSLKTQVEKLLPSTVTVLGARTTARLLTAAGSLRQFAGLSASRIQLLGSKRRSPGRTPRYGYIYLAEGMDRVPFDRRGALARSLASMAAIALRGDTLTHSNLSKNLSLRKERRIRELERAGTRKF